MMRRWNKEMYEKYFSNSRRKFVIGQDRVYEIYDSSIYRKLEEIMIYNIEMELLTEDILMDTFESYVEYDYQAKKKLIEGKWEKPCIEDPTINKKLSFYEAILELVSFHIIKIQEKQDGNK